MRQLGLDGIVSEKVHNPNQVDPSPLPHTAHLSAKPGQGLGRVMGEAVRQTGNSGKLEFWVATAGDDRTSTNPAANSPVPDVAAPLPRRLDRLRSRKLRISALVGLAH
jgi:hypothetical protein